MKNILIIILCLFALGAQALPRFALISGGSCNNCHINANGGGMRGSYATTVFGREQLPLIATRATKFKFNPELAPGVTIGADVRMQYLNYNLTTLTINDSVGFTTETKLSGVQAMQASVYCNAELTDGLSINLKQDFFSTYGFEANATLKPFDRKAYIRAGVFQPGFGLRMDDHQLATRGGGASTGAGPSASNNGLFFGPHYKDIGVEAGGEYYDFTASLGMFSGGYEARNSFFNAAQGATAPIFDTTYAYVARLGYFPSVSYFDGLLNYFLGGSVYKHDHVQLVGGFYGLRIGPVQFVGEYDATQSLPYTGFTGIHSAAMVGEITLNVLQGIDLQARYDAFDRDINKDDGTFERKMFGVAFYPIPYIELLAQYRLSTLQNDSQEKLFLVQTHVWF